MDRAEHARDEPVGPPIVLPPRPPEPGPAGFPLLATVAPMAGALVLWMVTGSVISLAFAALGPLVAGASVLDARRQARRIRRRAAAERTAQRGSVQAEIVERHAVERLDAWRRAPAARRLAETSVAADWRDSAPGAVVIGRGETASALRVEGTPIDAADRELVEQAARLEDAPVLAHAALGIGIVGPPALARATARGVLLQLAHRCRPDVVGLEVPDDPDWSWAKRLPHHDGGGDRVIRLVDAGAARSGRSQGYPARGTSVGTTMPPSAMPIRATGAAIAVAPVPAALPPGLATIVQVSGHGTATVDRRGVGGSATAITPELVGLAEAAAWAERMRAAAARDGYVLDTSLAAEVALDELDQPALVPASRTSLRVRVGLRRDGPVELDLVAGGPHAIVAGTTGSGKSEFLLTWLAALAGVYPPDRVAFLLVDFKGGAAFEPLRGLPHVVGIVTDLDESEAERAVLSLRAELRHRESVLRDERIRDVVELRPEVDLPRLVIVVDEFQAMIERFPELGAVIADIAARGRSLGVHLVLASQRPNGVVRDQVTANSPIRVSLRVMQRADSIAVVGTDAAAAIRSDLPGRGVIDVGDGIPVVFQSARVDAASLDRLRNAHVGTERARRPWQDPLPTRLAPDELDRAAASARLEPGAIPIGLVDVPERQRHDVLAWTPASDGHLLVLGAPGSGRTTTLGAIARAAERHARLLEVIWLNGPRSRRWDLLEAICERVREARPQPLLLLMDDLDTALRDWPDEHRQAGIEAIEAILRDGRRAGVVVAASAAVTHRMGAGIREAFGRQLLLHHASRADLVHDGGAGELWRAHEPPGAGQWDAHRVQVVDAPHLPEEPHPAPEPLQLGDGLVALVSASPRADLATLREAGLAAIVLEPAGDTAMRAMIAGSVASVADAPGPRIVVGDADTWAASWSVAALLREEATIVVHGGAREQRVFRAGRGLPPLLDDAVAQCIVTSPDGPPRRAAWPPSTTQLKSSPE